jgi:hypothetical protein
MVILVIGITATLGLVALGLGMFVLGSPGNNGCLRYENRHRPVAK